MANFFDQFDPPQQAASPQQTTGNFFDQFDPPQRTTPIGRIPRPGVDAPSYTREPTTSAWSDVGGAAHRVLNAANAELANTGGLVPSALTYGGHGMLPTGVRPGQTVGTNIRELGGVTEQPPPANEAEAMEDAAGKALGANVVPMGVTGNLAASGARFAKTMAPGIIPAAKRGANELLDAIARRPAAALAGEGVASLESGAGGEAARNATERAGGGPGAQGFAQTFGQFTAPTIASTVTPTAIGSRVASKLAGPAMRGARAAFESGASMLPDEYRLNVPDWVNRAADAGANRVTAGAEGTVSKDLNSALSNPDTAANVAEADALKSQIPGFNPGLARATNDPALLNVQRKYDAEATGDDLRARQAREQASRGAIQNAYENVVPPAGPNPTGEVTTAAARELAGHSVDAALADETARQNLANRSNIQPTQDQAASGATLRHIRQGMREDASGEVNRLRGNIAAPDTEIEVQPAHTNEAGEEVPAATMTVNEVLDRRAQINQTLRQYNSANMRTQQDVAAMERLQDERRHLDGLINDINLPGMQEYRAYYRDEFVPRFEQGASWKTGQYANRGEAHMRLNPEDVPQQFLGPNNITEARQFQRLYGDNPQARQAAIDYKLDEMRHAVIDPNNGLIKEGAVARYLQQNERLLNELPWLRPALAAHNPDELYTQIGAASARSDALQNTRLAKAMGQAGMPGKPADAITPALNDHVLMKQLADAVGPAGLPALRKAAFDRLRADAPNVVDNPDQFLAWLDGHNRSLAQVMTPDHMNSLRSIAQAARIQNRAPSPTGAVQFPKSIADNLASATGVTIPSAIGSVLAVARGRTSPFTEGPAQAVKWWRVNQARATRAAWDKALTDPDFAKTVATVTRAKTATPLQVHKMYSYLFTSGALGLTGSNNGPQ